MRVMVTGSREWTDRETMHAALLDVDAEAGVHVLVHGDAQGADHMASWLAVHMGWAVVPLPALVEVYGDWPECGPLRNAALVSTRPDICLAFPTLKSRGTWDAVRKARAAGIPVRIVEAKC